MGCLAKREGTRRQPTLPHTHNPLPPAAAKGIGLSDSREQRVKDDVKCIAFPVEASATGEQVQKRGALHRAQPRLKTHLEVPQK